MTDRLILAQISDLHIRADDDGASVRQLRAAMAHAQDYKAEALLLTGDLSNDERPEEYAALAQALRDAPAPVYVLPGNHDDRQQIRSALGAPAYLPADGPLSYVIETLPLRIVMVDQIVPGETHGEFTRAQAAWLDGVLSAKPSTPTVVALHHPPFPTHDVLFDTIALRRQDLFADVIARHRQVVRIICGHHHRVIVGQVAHAPVVVAPSTSWAYGLAIHGHQPIAPRTAEQPGWMLHVWTRAGGLASHFMGI
ncbi:MAG: metallophosphoesterase [Hyphomonadaceae bacterium]|nr:metallophosphoesterase [Hyphomonadaceae bacterium]